MTLLKRVYNRWFVRGFLINSLPKAGTHLLEKVVASFAGVRHSNIHFGFLQPVYPQPWASRDEPAVPLGVASPRYVARSLILETLRMVGRGRFATAHVPYAPEWAALLTALGMKTLLILRDPRDVVVSHAHYVAATPSNPLFRTFQPLTVPERILASIVGIVQPESEGPGLLGIGARCRCLLPWVTHPLNYTTRFEKLVGPAGGGSRDTQLEEIANIARHLNLKNLTRERHEIVQNLFGGTATFRKGTIGNWQQYFTEEHKRAFKQEAGQILIDLDYEQDERW
jgi:hypothetical protein